MSFPGNTSDESAVCPYLGLADDAESHATYATEAHRCFRLPNPTRIAAGHQEGYCLGANHPSCPVYMGEGVEATTARPVPVPPPFQQEPPAQRPFQPAAAPPPQWEGGPEQGGPPFAPDERPIRRPSPGSVGGRTPRSGISMPMATVGLFALAIVVVVIAFFINQQLGDDNGGLTPDERFQTQQAQTQQAGGGETPTPPAGETPTAGETPGPGDDTPTAEPTAAEETPTTDPGGGGSTYEIQPGDTCGAIAADNGVALEDLLDANDLTEDDCLNLQVGDELIIP